MTNLNKNVGDVILNPDVFCQGEESFMKIHVFPSLKRFFTPLRSFQNDKRS